MNQEFSQLSIPSSFTIMWSHKESVLSSPVQDLDQTSENASKSESLKNQSGDQD